MDVLLFSGSTRVAWSSTLVLRTLPAADQPGERLPTSRVALAAAVDGTAW